MKKRDFVLRGFNAFTLAERICGGACAKQQAGEKSQYFPSPLAGETSPHFPSPLAKFWTADKPVSESRNHGSEVMTGAGAKEFQDAGDGLGVRGNKAFTLAEVLITLVIIGVIGALTVPALIQNTQKQEYVSALKKAYSTLSQATQQIIAEEGSPKGEGSWLQDVDSVYDMYKKYLNTARDCGSGAECAPQKGFKWRNGGYSENLSYSKYRHLILSDGIQISFSDEALGNSCNSASDGSNNYCARIYADVNGAKKPNEMGRDVFVFVIKENGLFPMGCDTSDNLCTKDYSGWGCACKVLREGAMNY